MDTNPSNARELVALRSTLNDSLTLPEIRSINWATVAKAAAPAIARGWTGDELARWALGDLGERTDSVGAVIVSVLRDLATVAPHREATPEPPPAGEVLAAMHARHQPAADPGQWAERIRQAASR